ncbi:MAG: hypothetical protein M3Q09_10605 [Gemmatimonadota bacterium]|nr:hypothetical protein [Gemmatimonadota bacterium]
MHTTISSPNGLGPLTSANDGPAPKSSVGSVAYSHATAANAASAIAPIWGNLFIEHLY